MVSVKTIKVLRTTLRVSNKENKVVKMNESSVRRFAIDFRDSLSYVRTVDGFLIKLGSLILKIEDYCSGGSCDPEELLNDVLRSAELRKYLGKFSCFKGDIYEAVMSDPRHKKIRKYLGVLRGVLEEIECVPSEADDIVPVTPPALWVKERAEEKRARGPIEIIHEGVRGLDVEKVLIFLLIGAAVIFLLSIIFR